MNLRLSVGDDGLDPEDLHALTVDLRRSVISNTDLDASLVSTPAEPGTKGDPITVGAIVLALITSGAVANLVGVLSTFASRRSSLQFEVSRTDGEVLKLNAENLSGGQVAETITVLKSFVSEAP
jgi:hypothetical protein